MSSLISAHVPEGTRPQPELRYDAERAALAAYAPRFAPLAPDADTQAWIDRYGSRPHGMLKTWWVEQLGRFVSAYEAHGLADAYAMHLLSPKQWGELCGGPHGRLLDVGAGAGYVTENARGWFDAIQCTETSPALARRLRERGLSVHPHDLVDVPLANAPAFDVISCLNVLDRTTRPISLLRALGALARPSTRLLVALPLPVRAYVLRKGASVSPDEPLGSVADRFEDAACELSALFERLGFAIERIARLPYLSRGDHRAPMYVLDDAVWVLRKASSAPQS
jgi:SAM-dependent methyltransferase